jgi:hypothetical protein
MLIERLSKDLVLLVKEENLFINKINELPKGAVKRKTIRNNEYGYLSWREGTKIFQKYLGPYNSDGVSDMIGKTAMRKLYEDKLRQMRNERKLLEKILKPKKPRGRCATKNKALDSANQ